MGDSKLKIGISYILILLFACVVANGSIALAGSFALGALFRLILLPFVVLMSLLVIVQNWETEWLSFSWFSFSQRKSTMVFIVSLALLGGVFIYKFEGALNIISIFVIFLIIGCYFFAFHFINNDKDHYALALFIVSLPLVDFVGWDSGIKGGVFVLEIGHIIVPIKGMYIAIGVLFAVWAADKVLRKRFHLAGSRRYTPIILMLLYSFFSIMFITSRYNQGQAFNRILSILVFPLLVYILAFEIVDTKKKMYLIAHAAIAMVVMHTFINYYMSYRTTGIGFTVAQMAVNAGKVRYGMGSPTVKAMELALITPLLIALWSMNRNRFYGLLYSGLIAFVVIAQLMAFNRGGLLAALVGSACLLKNRKIRRGAIATLSIIIVFWTPFYNNFLVRFHNIFDFGWRNITLQELSYSRYQGWIAAIKMWAEHPIFGVGLSNFGDYAHLFSAPYPAVSPRGEDVLIYMSDAHNLFLEIGSELGIVGLGLMLFFLCWLFFDLIKGLRAVKGSDMEPFAWALVGVFMVTMVFSFTADAFWVAKLTLGHNIIYWTLFALIGRLRWIKQEELETKQLYA